MGDDRDISGSGKNFSAAMRRWRERRELGLLAALLLPAIALAVGLAIGERFPGFPFLLFFPAVVIATFLGGWVAGALAAFTSELLSDYFLLPPFFSLAPGGGPGVVALVVFNLVSAIVIALVEMLSRAMTRLSALADALTLAKESLELRVAERTRELAAANAALRDEIAHRKAVEAHILQTQKLEAVGQLTGGIAHDFNNMLQAIGGSLDLLRRRLAQGRVEQLGRYLDAAADATERAAQLTQRLLAFARRQALAPEPIRPNEMIEAMAKLIGHTVGASIEVTLDLDRDVAAVLCDPSQLEAALMNLALNARDAMPAGGRLTLSTRAANPTAPDGHRVEIAVKDTGVGMSDVLLQHAFDPFFTTKPIGKGAGLGLSQVHGFVHQSKGEVRIESAPGRGTTVRLFLPSATLDRDDPATPHAGATAASHSQALGLVLLVEDEPLVRTMTAEVLRELGCEVLEAGDGQEALGILGSGRIPDLLISDIGLPGGLNGRQIADAARERRPDLPVLLITGYAGTALERGLELGMEVLTKPFSVVAFSEAVRAILLGHVPAAAPQL